MFLLEAIATRTVAIAIGLEAIAIRLETIAIREAGVLDSFFCQRFQLEDCLVQGMVLCTDSTVRD